MLYEEFMRRELTKRVRAELEVRIEQQWIPVEESLKRQLVEMSHDIQLKLLEDFMALRGNSSRPQKELVEDDKVVQISHNLTSMGLPFADATFVSLSDCNDHETADSRAEHNAQHNATETPASSCLITNKPTYAYEPYEAPYASNTDYSATGDQLIDDFGLPQHFFEGASWGPCDVFLADASTSPWSAVFSNMADAQLAPAPELVSSVTTPIGASSRIIGIVTEDSAVAPTGLGRQLNTPQDLLG